MTRSLPIPDRLNIALKSHADQKEGGQSVLQICECCATFAAFHYASVEFISGRWHQESAQRQPQKPALAGPVSNQEIFSNAVNEVGVQCKSVLELSQLRQMTICHAMALSLSSLAVGDGQCGPGRSTPYSGRQTWLQHAHA